MKALVTGSDGFIGSHLTEALVRAGFQVKAFACYNSFGSLGWLDHVESDILDSHETILGDIRDPNAVRNAMDGCDVVFHLAALIGIPYSYRAPDSYVDTNVKGTLNVLQAARDLGNVRVVHTSTSEVYGTAQFVPITEEHRIHAQSPYAASKAGADQMALSYSRSFDLPVVVVRPFNTYGPRQSNRAVIPTVISQIAGGVKSLKLGDLSPTRDFNFVTDTVEGFIAASRSGEASLGEEINLASNFEVSIGTMVDLIVEVMGVTDVEIESDEARMRPADSEVFRLWGDNSKAKKLLGWEPSFGGLEGFKRGLRRTADWFTEPENLKAYKVNSYGV